MKLDLQIVSNIGEIRVSATAELSGFKFEVAKMFSKNISDFVSKAKLSR